MVGKMTDTSKYPHQSVAWVLFIVFVLLFLSGVYYYSQGDACYHNAAILPHWGSTVSTPPCGDIENIGISLLVISLLPILSFGAIPKPKKRMKCPKCGYEFGGIE